MDFDIKLSLFKKKALLKQLEGYKSLVSQKEAELNKCQQEKTEAERTSKAVNLTLSKIKNVFASIMNFESEIHDSLKPLKEFLAANDLDSELNENFLNILCILSTVLSGKFENVKIKSIEPAVEIQKELVISELKTELDEQKEKSLMLENKIFSLEKSIFALKSFQNAENNNGDSPSKRPRLEQGTDGSSFVAGNENENQEIAAKLNVKIAELEELKKITKNQLTELESLQTQNIKLTEELESKKDQLKRIPQDILKDGVSFRRMSDDIDRYKNDLNDAKGIIRNLEKELDDSNYRNNKIISQLERDIKEKYTKLEEFIKTTDSEITRLRKDRDSMRQMYEQTNAMLSSSQKQLIYYQKNINCSETAISELTKTVEKLKSHISLIPAVNSGSADCNKAIEALRSDEQLYIEELENLGKAFEQLQTENSNLVKKIAEKDDQISKLMGDKLKAEFTLSQSMKEVESSLDRAQKIEELAKHRVTETESREELLRRQMASMDKGLSEQLLAINSYKSRLSEASGDNSYLRSKVEKQATEIAELKEMIPAQGYKDQLAYEKRRLMEELSVANKKLDAYAASGVGLVKELEEELGNYKKLMKCNSCHTRDKNAVILKCMHCFCKTCLDIRLETRQRKCPNCGDAFGAGDVKQIFL